MIFTIGYSNRSLPEFLRELQKRTITVLVDVRSSLWSRNAPFTGRAIEQWADRSGILYRQSGEVLGGRSQIGLDDPRYVAALDRLIQAAAQETVVIMCSEGRPEDCHRTTEVAASLLFKFGVVARSILRDGSEEDVTETLARVPASKFGREIGAYMDGQPDLLF